MAIEAANVRRGAVVLVRLPRDKARPAVVVRSDLLSRLSHATVLPITSELHPEISLRIIVEPSADNGLQTISQVMADWPRTVRYSDIDSSTMAAITRQTAVVLGIGTLSRGTE